MKQTTNYQLPQWEETDRIMMKDFNDMTEKIDGGLAAKCEVVIGTYTCPVQVPIGQPRHISLGFRPKAVLIWYNRVVDGSYNFNHSALVLDGYPLKPEALDNYVAEVEDDGFCVQRLMPRTSFVYPDLMDVGNYHYIAFR